MTTYRVPVRYLSPLRYPGGKGRLAKFTAGLIERQTPRPSRYIEPFAGGAGVGLRLLVDEHVDDIVINDLNPGIAAFWRAVFERPEELLAKLESCRVDVEEWRCQRQIYLEAPEDDVELGFALFFLNRTNRSGILDARPMAAMSRRVGGRSTHGSTRKAWLTGLGSSRRMAAAYPFAR